MGQRWFGMSEDGTEVPQEKLESAVGLLRRQQRHDVADWIESQMPEGSGVVADD